MAKNHDDSSNNNKSAFSQDSGRGKIFDFDKERYVSVRDYSNAIFLKDFWREYPLIFAILTFFRIALTFM